MGSSLRTDLAATRAIPPAAAAGGRLSGRPSRPRGTGFVVAGLSVLALLAAACGGGPKDSVASIGSTTSTTNVPVPAGGSLPSGALASQLEKYASCMRSHGEAGFPSPVFGPNGGVGLEVPAGMAQSPQFKRAANACQGLLPNSPEGAGFTAPQQADYLKAASCMRSHGIVGFPDPVFSPNVGVRFRIPTGMNVNSIPFRRARVICEKLIPQGLPYSN
jgi:hypothetical protein